MVHSDSCGFKVKAKNSEHRLLVSRGFLGDTLEVNIEVTLKARGVAPLLRAAGEEWVVVGASGTRIGLQDSQGPRRPWVADWRRTGL